MQISGLIRSNVLNRHCHCCCRRQMFQRLSQHARTGLGSQLRLLIFFFVRFCEHLFFIYVCVCVPFHARFIMTL